MWVINLYLSLSRPGTPSVAEHPFRLSTRSSCTIIRTSVRTIALPKSRVVYRRVPFMRVPITFDCIVLLPKVI